MASQSLLDCSDAAGLVNSMSAIPVSTDTPRRGAAELSLTVHTKLVERLSDLDLGFEVEIRIGELLAFP
jgi:hypothetical protein